MSSSHIHTRRIMVLAITAAGALLIAGCGSSPGRGSTQKQTTPSAHHAVVEGYATCQTITGGVRCVLPNTNNHITLSDLLTEADQRSTAVTTSTMMVITAIGGYGGGNPTAGTSPRGGYGGKAQTSTTAAKYKAAYGTDLYYYSGANGTPQSSKSGNNGASATLVSWVDLDTAKACVENIDGCTTTNVLLVAGGGGGSGIKEFCNGGKGGTGGTAVAPSGSYAAGAGVGGSSGDCSDPGKGGGGGNDGSGGGGGGAGGGATGHDGGTGYAGTGGRGGTVHDGGTPPYWDGVGKLSAVGTNGAGGEGQFRGANGGTSDGNGCGGGGGGGFGGGGGGGGGGYDFAGGGGGGGGSYAAASTVTTPSTFNYTASSSNAQVVVTFLT